MYVMIVYLKETDCFSGIFFSFYLGVDDMNKILYHDMSNFISQ